MRGAISSTTRAYASPLALECEAAWARLVLAFKAFVQVAIKAGFNPGQPRMPAGNPDGGQWTGSGGSGDGLVQLASSRRQTVRVRFGRSYHEATPGQSMRLANAAAWARNSRNRIRQIEPNWKPRSSLTETVEGEIRALEAAAREADALIRAAQVYGGTLSGARSKCARTDGSVGVAIDCCLTLVCSSAIPQSASLMEPEDYGSCAMAFGSVGDAHDKGYLFR